MNFLALRVKSPVGMGWLESTRGSSRACQTVWLKFTDQVVLGRTMVIQVFHANEVEVSLVTGMDIDVGNPANAITYSCQHADLRHGAAFSSHGVSLYDRTRLILDGFDDRA